MPQRFTLIALTLVLTGAQVGALVPGNPTNLVGSAAGQTVTLSWQPPASAIREYVIEAGSSPGLANLANFSTGSAATQFAAAGVGAGTYYVRVRAANTDGTSGPSNEVRIDVGGSCVVPIAPGGLSSSLSGSSLALRWTQSPGAATYVVEAGSAPGLSNIANVDLGSNVPALTATSVAPGTYFIRIRARATCGLSAASNEISVTVGGAAGGLAVSFEPDPATPEPPNSCLSIWAGAQYTSTIVVTNASPVGVTINAVTIFKYDERGTLTETSRGLDFAIPFVPCDDPNAYFGSRHIAPGERRCLYDYCYTNRFSAGGSRVWQFDGVDDLGRPLSASGRLALPPWPY